MTRLTPYLLPLLAVLLHAGCYTLDRGEHDAGKDVKGTMSDVPDEVRDSATDVGVAGPDLGNGDGKSNLGEDDGAKDAQSGTSDASAEVAGLATDAPVSRPEVGGMDGGVDGGSNTQDALGKVRLSAAAVTITAGRSTTLVATFAEGTGVVTPSIGLVTSGVAVTTGPLNESVIYTLTVTVASGAIDVAQVTVNVLPKPVTVVSGLSASGIVDMAIDSTSLYFIVADRVLKVALAGGDVVTLASGGQPSAIVADGTGVYWTTYDDYFTTGSVMKIGVSGGEPVSIAAVPDISNTIALDGTNVYWTNSNKAPQRGATREPGTGSVMKVGISGGNVVTLADGQYEPDAIAVDATHVYWNGYSTDSGGAMSKVAISGGEPATLVLGLSNRVSAMTVDASGIYWTSSTGPLMKMPLQGGASTYLVQKASGGRDLVLDGESLYFLYGNSVARTALEGGEITTLALPGRAGTRGLVTDDAHVYWGDNGLATGDSAILKTAK